MASLTLSKNLVNFLLFQLAWVGFVVGAANDFIVLGVVALLIMLLWQLWPSRRADSDIGLIVTSMLIGSVTGTVWAATGLIEFRSHWPLDWLAPWWIVAMWASFGATLNHSLLWIQRSPWLAAVLGAIGGPASYAAAARIGAVTIEDFWLTMALMSVAWFLALLVLMRVAGVCSAIKKERLADVW
ncbi:DUF2878 domain-containing protein [Kangiella shandongensis]|uniref:DUF2878 domain-containing protein n=1 Tax=Kangiella shandongensis TaxID=2763258 RepID=UPI001CC0840E|nr:DUF2878 domain-containing protein [Kangiella shandongensis]